MSSFAHRSPRCNSCRYSTLLVLPLVSLLALQLPGEEATLVIDNARVIVGDGRIIAPATVVVTQDRIGQVISGKQHVDADHRIDADGMTVMPGLIDAHVHLIQPSGAKGEEEYRTYLKTEVPKNLESYLRHGVTTIKSVGDSLDLILELRDEVNKGSLASPRVLIVGSCLSTPGGHPSATFFSSDSWARSQICIEVSDEVSAAAAVRRLAEKQVDAIKLVYDGGPFKPGGETFHRLPKELLRAIIREAHLRNLPATVHTWREEEAIDAIDAGADGVEHGAPVAKLSDNRLGELLCARKAYYVPTLQVLELHLPKLGQSVLDAGMHNLKTLSGQGVKIVLGTDTFGTGKHGEGTIRELELMAAAGLSPERIIRAATCDAAAFLKRSNDLGSIESGKFADLLILDGDPLRNISEIRRIKKVLKAGRIVYDADAAKTDQAQTGTPLTIQLDKQGRLEFKGESMDLSGLKDKLKAVRAGLVAENSVVEIRADGECREQYVDALISSCRELGFTRFRLRLREPADGEEPSKAKTPAALVK